MSTSAAACGPETPTSGKRTATAEESKYRKDASALMRLLMLSDYEVGERKVRCFLVNREEDQLITALETGGGGGDETVHLPVGLVLGILSGCRSSAVDTRRGSHFRRLNMTSNHNAAWSLSSYKLDNLCTYASGARLAVRRSRCAVRTLARQVNAPPVSVTPVAQAGVGSPAYVKKA